jgi:hypothetical protein
MAGTRCGEERLAVHREGVKGSAATQSFLKQEEDKTTGGEKT